MNTRRPRGCHTIAKFGRPDMSANTASEFEKYLSSKCRITFDPNSTSDLATAPDTEKTFRKLWELTDLSAGDFADRGRPLLWPAAPRPCRNCSAHPRWSARFSRRFLRETMVFPYQSADGELQARGRRPERSRGRPRRRNRARRTGRDRGRLVRGYRDRARPSGSARTTTAPAAAKDDAVAPRRRRHRQPARSCERRAGRARGQRSSGKGHGAARQRHPYRAVPHRPRRAHAGRRLAARGAGAGRRPAAGADLAHQDSGRPQHRRAAAAAGRRRAPARRALRYRYSRRHHADAARRIGGDPPAAAAIAVCSRSASSACRAATRQILRGCWRCRMA